MFAPAICKVCVRGRYGLLITGRYSPPSTMTTVAVAVPLAVIVGAVALPAVSVGAVDAHSLAHTATLSIV